MGIEGAGSHRDQEKKRRVRIAETVGKAGYSLDRRRGQGAHFPSSQE